MRLYTGTGVEPFKDMAHFHQGQPPEAGTPGLPDGTETV